MAKTLPLLVFVTFITSGLALILSIVALGTDSWVQGGVDLNTAVSNTVDNRVNYGLFTGNYDRTVSTLASYHLTITCDFGRNQCAMLCGDTNLRTTYLQSLFDNNVIDGYGLCNTRSARTFAVLRYERSLLNESSQTRADEDDGLDGFINCGMWLTTVIFAALGCLFGVISTFLAVWNTVSNPVETIFSIVGLFAFNLVAFGCNLVAIVLWGVHFALHSTSNIGIYDTISTAGDSDGQAALGYSYWLTFVGCIGYASSAIILGVRQYLINKEPDTIVNLEDNNDNTIILF